MESGGNYVRRPRAYDARAPERAASWSSIVAIPVLVPFVWPVATMLWNDFLFFIDDSSNPGAYDPSRAIAYALCVLAVAVGWGAFQLVRQLLHTALLPPMATLVWLRKFDREGDNRFRLSRAVDALGQVGVCTITLEDASIPQSRPQRRRRWIAVFWTIQAFVGLVLLGAFFMPAGQDMAAASTGPVPPWVGFVSAWVLFVPASLLLARLFTSKFGSSELQSLADVRDRMDTVFLRPRGAWLFRVRDDCWRQSVLHALAEADAVLVDVSEVTEHIIWEIEQAAHAAPRDRIVFLIDSSTLADHDALQRLEARLPAFSEQIAKALAYPADCISERESAAFRSNLHDRVIAALTSGAAV